MKPSLFWYVIGFESRKTTSLIVLTVVTINYYTILLIVEYKSKATTLWLGRKIDNQNYFVIVCGFYFSSSDDATII